MKWQDWLDEWGMTSVKINLRFAEAEFAPRDGDKDAAWELYIEMLTRIVTQPLPSDAGDEKTALDSVYSLFGLTREIIRQHGRQCVEFTKIAIVVLNQVVRPFTADWHRKSLAGAFEHPDQCSQFREELRVLQEQLLIYTRMLGDMAGVEDLTMLESK